MGETQSPKQWYIRLSLLLTLPPSLPPLPLSLTLSTSSPSHAIPLSSPSPPHIFFTLPSPHFKFNHLSYLFCLPLLSYPFPSSPTSSPPLLHLPLFSYPFPSSPTPSPPLLPLPLLSYPFRFSCQLAYKLLRWQSPPSWWTGRPQWLVL